MIVFFSRQACLFAQIVYNILKSWGNEMYDLFNGSQRPNTDENFRWSVAVFRSCGASDTIRRANGQGLRTYYPIRRNKSGDLVPLWRNYLFIEYSSFTIDLCRATSNFIKILSATDDEGNNHPILVRKNAIKENMRLLELGIFDEIEYKRQFYGQGSLVKITSGQFEGKWVELLADIPSDMPGSKKIPIDILGWRGSIEIFKLAL
jgi:hypothetical protein